MRRANLDRRMLKDQLELVDILADTAIEEDKILLDGLGNFLNDIICGDIVCYYKEENGITE